jgi:hypothetical protein
MEAKIVVLENKINVLSETVQDMKTEIKSLKQEIHHLTINTVSRTELKEIWDKIDELLNKLVTAEAARTQKELDLAIKEKESLQEDNKKWIFEIVKQAVGILIALGLYHFGIRQGHPDDSISQQRDTGSLIQKANASGNVDSLTLSTSIKDKNQ